MRSWNRSMVPLLTLLGAGLLPVALADTPAEPAATPSTATPVATSATAPAAATNAAAASSAASSSAAAGSDSDAALEKHLATAGYKSRVKDGTKVWCKPQQELGTRLGARQEVCATADEWRRSFRDNQDVVEHIQRVGSQPSGK